MQTLTKYQKAYQILKQLEYGKRPEKFLHQNKNEEYLTLGGCYEKFWKTQIDWEFVHKIYTACSYDMKRASTMLFNDSKTRAEVAAFFKKEFWDRMRLDEVQSQKICNEIFLHGVHRGTKNAIKLAQKQIGVLEDGIIGENTLRGLNNYNEDKFDREFDKLEIDVYSTLAVFDLYKDGFTNRSQAV